LKESSRAFIAFGSNLGDRVGHIEKALKEMEKRQLKIKSVSALYETDPMYVTNQDTFLNGVCEVSQNTALSNALDI
jgi:2-amino-4-hydroxy-6-hydroxymethyldihydropteridine diphosphokinase/dihydropteroate synthase